ncbi:unnamed protein product [Cyprideis torosa]|uniref:NAD(+) kinase n=1 Tax=Cyprideis torosa TaxID=163714 RepID=A0A7R8W3K0_9CRUS|nr:unnamed protein product [Cyprideis torosa]CAG0880958.1 unnamed protein product [Cyprideis torosa]
MSEEEGVGKSPPPIPEQPSIPKASVVKEVVNPPNPTLRSREDNVPKILMFRSKGPVFRSKSADYNSICGSRVSSSGHVFRRTRSLNAPSPVQQFGPCGRIMKNSAMVMTIQDPASQRLVWYKAPLTVLVVKKVRDASVHHPFIQLVSWLIHEKRMVVTVEASVMQDPLLRQNPGFMAVKDKLTTFQEGEDDLTDRIDFIICLGGDGTLLYASSLFQQSVPPIMAFHLGSLGFLAPFEFDGFRAEVTKTLDGKSRAAPLAWRLYDALMMIRMKTTTL